jgi:chemotaxis regulatin CheY-phosphate phosphatase CheZ
LSRFELLSSEPNDTSETGAALGDLFAAVDMPDLSGTVYIDEDKEYQAVSRNILAAIVIYACDKDETMGWIGDLILEPSISHERIGHFHVEN